MSWLDAFGRAWAAIERGAWRLWRWLRREQQAIEAEAQKFGEDLLSFVDELVFVVSHHDIPPIRNQFYGHGAFMGAAPSLLADARWRRILAFLMPDVYDDVRVAVAGGAGPVLLIPMFENNPVMCAYGVWRGMHARRRYADFGRHDLAGMEWDVFIDGAVATAWARAGDAERPALVARLVDTMVIAHASSTDTVQEHLGLDQYLDVRKTAKTRLGGVEPGAWMDLFARALELAEAPDLDAAVRAMAREPRVTSEEACRDRTFARPRAWEDAIDVFRRFTGREHFGVILEIKSLRSSPALLAAMVAELNRRGVYVAAVGSFLLDEIRGVSAMRQTIRGEIVDGPREVLFQHFAGDLQAACDLGAIPMGQHVMFNGASLLDAHQEEGGPVVYRVKEAVIDELHEYVRRYDLHVGVYVQEGDCDAVAAALLSEVVMREPSAFALGFAWGGILDEAAFPGGGAEDRRGYGGQRYLERLGRARQWRTKAERDAAKETA